ncbi:MAG: hypothetical protein AAFX94_23125 [Myxococcota bacterium]
MTMNLQVSFADAEAFVQASGPYALRVAQAADANNSGTLSRSERANLGDLQDTFELMRQPGRAVPVRQGATQYAAIVRTAVAQAIAHARDAEVDFILPTQLPVHLQQNLVDFVVATGGDPAVEARVRSAIADVIKSDYIDEHDFGPNDGPMRAEWHAAADTFAASATVNKTSGEDGKTIWTLKVAQNDANGAFDGMGDVRVTTKDGLVRKAEILWD